MRVDSDGQAGDWRRVRPLAWRIQSSLQEAPLRQVAIIAFRINGVRFPYARQPDEIRRRRLVRARLKFILIVVFTKFKMRSLVVFLALLSVTAQAETITGRVLGISDGDTLTLVDATKQQHKIHMLGIDAPELTQDFGQNARTRLSALALSQPAAADCNRRDRYRHQLCVVSVGGKDPGLEQIRTGMAWWNRQHVLQQTAQQRAAYEQAEFTAKIHRLGLWNSKNPTPPWDWRYGRLEE